MFSGIRYLLSAMKLNVIATIKGNSVALRTLGVKVGEGSRIYTRSFGGEPWLVSIGDRVTVTLGSISSRMTVHPGCFVTKRAGDIAVPGFSSETMYLLCERHHSPGSADR